MTGVVRLERPADGIVVVTLNRPDRLNAVNAQMIAELAEVLRTLRRSRSDNVVVLTGMGRGFCAGMDQKTTGYEEQTAGGDLDGLLGAQRDIADLVVAVRALNQPVIAAVNGAAVGAGMALTLACDLRFAAEGAKFSVGAINIGLAGADMGMTWHLPRVVGTSRAAEWLLTGRPVSAQEALTVGLVSQVTPADGLMAATMETARHIAAKPDFSVRLTKRALWSNVTVPDLATAAELENQTQVLASGRLLQTARTERLSADEEK